MLTVDESTPGDTTPPTVTLTAPNNNVTVGGTVQVAADAADNPGGSGVTSVRFEYRTSPGGTWTTLATDTDQPFQTTWNTTTVADGAYDLRGVATDGAGNATNSAPVGVTVDNTTVTVSLADPGAILRATVPLQSNVSGGGVASVAFERRRPAASPGPRSPADTTSPTASTSTRRRWPTTATTCARWRRTAPRRPRHLDRGGRPPDRQHGADRRRHRPGQRGDRRRHRARHRRFGRRRVRRRLGQVPGRAWRHHELVRPRHRYQPALRGKLGHDESGQRRLRPAGHHDRRRGQRDDLAGRVRDRRQRRAALVRGRLRERGP